jgi:hypothetical protein
MTNVNGCTATSTELVTTISCGSSSACAGTGSITHEYWADVPGDGISAIPLNSSPNQVNQLPTFATPVDIGDNYGQRLRGYLCPPVNGVYQFYLAGDDQVELWLSSDEDPSHKQKIAYIDGWSMPNDYYAYASQQSAPIYLQAGQRYYVEALHKEGSGGDHLSVGWQLPDGTLHRPIAGTHLIPLTPEPNLVESFAAANFSRQQQARNELSTEKLRIYPNPSSEVTTITFSVPRAGTALLQIYNLQGSLVETLFNQKVIANQDNRVIWRGKSYAAGVYVVKLTYGNQVLHQRIVRQR